MGTRNVLTEFRKSGRQESFEKEISNSKTFIGKNTF